VRKETWSARELWKAVEDRGVVKFVCGLARRGGAKKAVRKVLMVQG
jgi:hypothetical protein